MWRQLRFGFANHLALTNPGFHILGEIGLVGEKVTIQDASTLSAHATHGASHIIFGFTFTPKQIPFNT